MSDNIPKGKCVICSQLFETFGDLSDYACDKCGYAACNSCTYTHKNKAYCETCFEKVNPYKTEGVTKPEGAE